MVGENDSAGRAINELAFGLVVNEREQNRIEKWIEHLPLSYYYVGRLLIEVG